MGEREALYAAVCAEPWADLPRLVYADYLDDHGEQERAEFIRLQCNLAERPMVEAGRVPSADRANALLRANCDAWGNDLPALSGVWWNNLYVRGFIDSATVRRSTKNWARLFASAPLCRLRLDGLTNKFLTTALTVPEFGRLRSLVLAADRDQRPTQPGRVLTRCTHLGRVEHLDIEQLFMSHDEVMWFLSGDALPALRTVRTTWLNSSQQQEIDAALAERHQRLTT